MNTDKDFLNSPNLSSIEEKKKAINLNTMIEVPVLEEEEEEQGEIKSTLESSYATGRRKEAVAKLWLFINRKEKFSLNKLKERINLYFMNPSLSAKVISPLFLLNENQNFAFSFNLKFKLIGGGKSGQSDALRLALAKALVLLFPDMRSVLRKAGLLTSDSRRKEREHPGFRTSRKPQQYSRR